MIRVEVQLKLDTALELRLEGARTAGFNPDTAELRKELADLTIQIQPVHLGQTHPLLAPFFWLEAPDELTAKQIIAKLIKLNAVEGAYLRPQDEPPQ
jgi:hypothetical protein